VLLSCSAWLVLKASNASLYHVSASGCHFNEQRHTSYVAIPACVCLCFVSNCFLLSVSSTGACNLRLQSGSGTCTVVSQLVSVSSPVWLQVVQQKVDHLDSLLQDEVSKPGRPTAAPWQQQHLHLRPVTAPASSTNSRSGSPSEVHTADAAVDTLQQQRAKLKPVQTSKHALPPVKRPAAALLRGQGTAAAVYPSFVKATTTRPAAPSQGIPACSLRFAIVTPAESLQSPVA